MSDNCPICQEALFSEEKGIIERPCHHFEHQECIIRKITADNQATAITICATCRSQKPHDKENIFYNSGAEWLKKAEQKCERKDCLYVHKGNDKAVVPDCPYPYSMFPDHGSASGFLHQYGKLVDELIVTQLGYSGIKASGLRVENITEEQKNEMERKYGKENDLKNLVEQFDENHWRAEECITTLERTFNQDFEHTPANTKSVRRKINSENMMDESENIRDRIQDAKQALSNRDISQSLIDLRAALENDREQSGGWGVPEVTSMISLSNPNPHELIPGLAESTDMDFSMVRNFFIDGVNHPFEVRLDSKILNESKSVNEAVSNVINCVRCELVMSKLMKNYPAYFDDKTKVYLKTPFDYWGDKIEIVYRHSKEQAHAIKLSEIFDFEKKVFNFTVFLDAVDKFKSYGINRHDLRNGPKLPASHRPMGRFGMERSNRQSGLFGRDSGGLAPAESPSVSRCFFDAPSGFGSFGSAAQQSTPPSRPMGLFGTHSGLTFGSPGGSKKVGFGSELSSGSTSLFGPPGGAKNVGFGSVPSSGSTSLFGPPGGSKKVGFGSEPSSGSTSLFGPPGGSKKVGFGSEPSSGSTSLFGPSGGSKNVGFGSVPSSGSTSLFGTPGGSKNVGSAAQQSEPPSGFTGLFGSLGRSENVGSASQQSVPPSGSMGLFGALSELGNVVSAAQQSMPPSGSAGLFGALSGVGNFGLMEAPQVPSSPGSVQIPVGGEPGFTGSDPATALTFLSSQEEEFIDFNDIL
ncbi:hypothetical protein J7438_13565 [Thalassotalea sp. G20_0]|uniref:hypothetical protein n=1 Tax=Thalassotalea sp. G20_0 TaxID=2821093 RepID=UPI001ADC62A1|nr:hypothetical protein [Thalassotalea sp. G20_0]MBO9495108.1 hypothetical protein [Thalassotalea sp. G20_0]